MSEETPKPHPLSDSNAEKALLGSILLTPTSLLEVVERIKPEHFVDKKHRLIWEGIFKLYNENIEIDPLSLQTKMKTERTFGLIGKDYLNELVNLVPTSTHIKSYAEMVVSLAMRRQILGLCEELKKKTGDKRTTVKSLVEFVEEKIMALADLRIGNATIALEAIAKELYAKIEDRDGLRGIESGFTLLDKWCQGWRPSDYIIIGARPGVGKTGFVLNLAANAAKSGKNVLIYSLEMSNEQLVDRIAGSETRFSIWQIRGGNIAKDKIEEFKTKAAEMMKLPIFLNDTSDFSISEIKADAKKMMAKIQVDMIIVDYLQLIRQPPTGSRYENTTTISRALKVLAGELNIPVIVASQLNRVENEYNPKISELRDSGAIEQDADAIILMSPLKPKKGQQTRMSTQIVNLNVAKQRHGQSMVNIKFVVESGIQRYSVLVCDVCEGNHPTENCNVVPESTTESP